MVTRPQKLPVLQRGIYNMKTNYRVRDQLIKDGVSISKSRIYSDTARSYVRALFGEAKMPHTITSTFDSEVISLTIDWGSYSELIEFNTFERPGYGYAIYVTHKYEEHS